MNIFGQNVNAWSVFTITFLAKQIPPIGHHCHLTPISFFKENTYLLILNYECTILLF